MFIGCAGGTRCVRVHRVCMGYVGCAGCMGCARVHGAVFMLLATWHYWESAGGTLGSAITTLGALGGHWAAWLWCQGWVPGTPHIPGVSPSPLPPRLTLGTARSSRSAGWHGPGCGRTAVPCRTLPTNQTTLTPPLPPAAPPRWRWRWRAWTRRGTSSAGCTSRASTCRWPWWSTRSPRCTSPPSAAPTPRRCWPPRRPPSRGRRR